MELDLSRVDYAQVGTTSRGCLVLLPSPGPGQGQRVVVGGNNGVLLCFSRRKHETSVVFKTLPGAAIESLAVGGALGTTQDKIFFAATNIIKGYSKKGKQFFAFETNLTEPVRSMYIYGVDMLLCGSHSFNHYHDCQDSNYFLCGDPIADVLCLPVTEGSWVGRGITPVLAVEDRTLKVLDGSSLAYQVPLQGSPQTLCLYGRTGGEAGQLVYFGTSEGNLGLVDLPVGSGSVIWEVPSPSGSAAVSAIDSYDLTGDGVKDMVVGRADGLVEIWSQEELLPPIFRQKVSTNESVTALRCGRVASELFDEIVILTYTGWVLALTTEPRSREVLPTTRPEELALDPLVEANVEQLRGELEQLSEEVAREREAYHAATQDASGLSAVPVFPINDRFVLSPADAAYLLTLELMVPMDYVLLQSDVPLDLLDVENNSAVVSQTACQPDSGNALLATYRCQANTTRLEIKVRSIEGQYGNLQAYVSPRTQPKICQLRQYPIKPLSLHQRIHNYDETRPQNTLKLTGAFSLGEAHSWCLFCLPELPEKAPPGEAAEFAFQSTFTGSQLRCAYSKGSALFHSDNISTIAILRDVLSSQATKRKIKLSISCAVSEESVGHTLGLLDPKLEYQLGLAKKVHLAEALAELSMAESDMSFVTEELADVMRRSEELRREHAGQQAHLERLYGVVTDLFIDKHKLNGHNAKARVPQLMAVLDNYSLASLQAFFQQPPHST